MQRYHEWRESRLFVQIGDDSTQSARFLQIFLPVEGCHAVGLSLESEPLENPRMRRRKRLGPTNGVEHQVANNVYPSQNSFTREVVCGALRGTEEERAQMVDDNAIDLLGHFAVVGTQPRLDMDDGNPALGSCERARQRGV